MIGIHKGAKNNNENETVFNIGILLKHPLDKLKAMKKSEIKITINIDEKEINKDKLNINDLNKKLNSLTSQQKQCLSFLSCSCVIKSKVII